MALPPRGDPRRPMHLAVRSMRVLGILFLALSTCIGFMFMRFGRMSALNFGAIVAFLVYVTPGVCYIVFSIFLMRRQFWAVVASIVLASLQLVLMLIGLAVTVISLLSARGYGAPLATVIVSLSILLLLIAALAQLIYHLSRSFEAIRYAPPGERGFEPLMATVYQPPGNANGPASND